LFKYNFKKYYKKKKKNLKLLIFLKNFIFLLFFSDRLKS